MEQAVRELLDSADDATEWYCDPGIDWDALHARVSRLQPKLERIAGRTFDLDDTAEVLLRSLNGHLRDGRTDATLMV